MPRSSRPRPNYCHCDDIQQWGLENANNSPWMGCNPLIRQLGSVKRKTWRIETVYDLVDSAKKARCQTCALILKVIRRSVHLKTVRAIELGISSAAPQLRVQAFLDRGNGKETFLCYLAHPEGYSGHEPFGRGVLRPPLQPRPGKLAMNVDAVIQQIQSWTRECLTYHQGCQSGGFSPRRLIRISKGLGDSVGSGLVKLRLIETWPNFSAPYAALSHCWGETQHETTTETNYQGRKAGIPFEKLSRTFQDTIWLAHRLGLQYLWIDSLCIVQDDAKDWDSHAVNMHRIYGAAHLTLAASYGKDGEAGLFPTSRSQLTSITRAFGNPDGEGVDVSVEMTIMPRYGQDELESVHAIFNSYEGISPEGHTQALMRRGWAFQERILSARVVHFTDTELVWECQATQACECGLMNGKKKSLLTAFMGSVKHRKAGFTAAERENEEDMALEGWEEKSDEEDEQSVVGDNRTNAEDEEDLQNQKIYDVLITKGPRKAWQDFVSIFTGRALTKPEDRLPAFAGFAQSFEGLMVTLDEYFARDFCAGLWIDDLPKSLMWSCSTKDVLTKSSDVQSHEIGSGTGGGKRIKNVMAPSWSWYSVSGECCFFTDLDNEVDPKGARKTMAHKYLNDDDGDVVVSYSFESMADGSPFGRLARGALTLEGATTVIMRRGSKEENFTLQHPSGNSLGDFSEVHLLLDDEADRDHVGELVCLCLSLGYHTAWIQRIKDVRPEWMRSETGHPLTEEELMQLDALADMDEEDYFYMMNHTYICEEHTFGVALVAATNEPAGTFRRIGLFHLEGVGCCGHVTEEQSLDPGIVTPPSGYMADLTRCWTRDRVITVI